MDRRRFIQSVAVATAGMNSLQSFAGQSAVESKRSASVYCGRGADVGSVGVRRVYSSECGYLSEVLSQTFLER